MRIALITSTFPLREGVDAGLPAVWELATEIKRQGHDLIVCTIGEADQPPIAEHNVAGIRVFAARWDDEVRKTCFDGAPSFNVVSWQLSRAKLAADAFSTVLSEFKPDVIECQEFHGLAFFLAAQHEYPIVIRCHGPMAHLMRNASGGQHLLSDIELVEGMEVSTLAAADGLISMCTDLVERLAALTTRPASDWKIIPAPFRIDATAQTAAKPATPTLFYFGRVDRLKGADLLLEAYLQLAQSHPNLRMVIGGQEMTEAGATEPYSNSMRARLKEHGLLERVQFRGFMTREQIKQQVAESTICVFPSRYETAGYAIFEAIAYGGVAVASKVGGVPDYHEHGTSAWLVEPDSVESLKAGIEVLLTDSSKYNEIREKAKAHVARICAPDKVVRESVACYEKAIETFRSRQPNGGDLAFKLFANHLKNALAEQPLWAIMPSHEQPPTRNSFEGFVRRAARSTKRIFAGEQKN